MCAAEVPRTNPQISVRHFSRNTPPSASDQVAGRATSVNASGWRTLDETQAAAAKLVTGAASVAITTPAQQRAAQVREALVGIFGDDVDDDGSGEKKVGEKNFF